MYIHPLTTPLDEPDVGGKASGLSNICALGLKVPKGFAISKEAQQLYSINSNYPQAILDDIKKVVSNLSGDQVIVRSSAIGEDSEDFSFAGQLDSFVVANTEQGVLEGVLKCWNSINNDRVKAYQNISGKALKEMGVVIQEFVEAEYSGVLFTQSPYNKENVYTEFVKGGAEPLVSGKVTPLSFSTNDKNELIESQKLPFNHKLLLQDAQIMRSKFGKHLDIEWIYKSNKFYFVQARPIKNIDKSKVYWTNTNLNENYPNPMSPLLYSIAQDSYYHYFKNLATILQLDKESIRKLKYDFSNTVGIFGNRIYYNMTSIHNIISASPYKAYLKDAFNQFVGYADKDASSNKVEKKPSPFRLITRLVRLNFSLDSHAKIIESKVSEFEERVTSANDMESLSTCYYEFLDLRFNQWYHASLADLFSMIHYKVLGLLTKKFYGSDHVGVHNTLIQGIPGLVTNKPLQASWEIIQEIEKIPNGKSFFIKQEPAFLLNHIKNEEEWHTVSILIKQYLKNWGFRCSGELEFETKNYIESPEKFIELLKSYIQCGQADPKKTIEKMDAERLVLMRSLIKNLFKKRHILFPIAMLESAALQLSTRLCRKAIYQRERVRYKQAQMYYNLKKLVFQLGTIFKEKDIIENEKDILFLNYKEIGSLLASSDIFTATYKDVLSIRKLEYAKESLLKFPINFETNFGERPSHVDDFTVDLKSCKEFKGLAASGGKKRAKVKVLESVFEAQKIQKGEILVTRQTDPGWAMLFPIIGGLIVERGGALSHGAIVAREFGIPAVVGIEGIMEVLKDNDEVILDGDNGKVQLL